MCNLRRKQAAYVAEKEHFMDNHNISIKDIDMRFAKMLEPKRYKVTGGQENNTSFSPYDSDYARVVLSAPFRRLQDKTQVFPLRDFDFARKRLTHSIEVAAFAKSIGNYVQYQLKDRLVKINPMIIEQQWIPRILETVALVHDIGNPPFGHKGEKVIKTFFRNISKLEINDNVKKAFTKLNTEQQADFCNFDGNVQGFRILTKLCLSETNTSLNLTYPVLATLIKYPYSSLSGNKDIKDNHEIEKFGYFSSEVDIYNKITTTLELSSHQRHPLTYIIEAADDIAYCVCDVEDGYHMGTITVEDIKNAFKKAELEEWLKQKVNYNLSDELFVMKLRIVAHSQMIQDCQKQFIDKYDQYVLGTSKEPLLSCSKSASIANVFKELENNNIHSSIVTKKEKEGCEAIRLLLTNYLETLFSQRKEIPYTKEYDIFNSMSENYWNVVAHKTLNQNDVYERFQYAVDQVAGMTDTFAIETANWIRKL